MPVVSCSTYVVGFPDTTWHVFSPVGFCCGVGLLTLLYDSYEVPVRDSAAGGEQVLILELRLLGLPVVEDGLSDG